jgi:hypothetical protein
MQAIAPLVHAFIDARHPFTPKRARDAAIEAVMAELDKVIANVVSDEMLAQYSFQLRRPGRPRRNSGFGPTEIPAK